jgi:PAS domain S-box-containing protein
MGLFSMFRNSVKSSIWNPQVLAENTALVGLSLLIGWITYLLGANSRYVVPFWPLSGISLYFYIRRGRSLVPALFISVFLLAYFFADRPFWLSLINSVFNAAETIFAGLIFRRLERHRETFGDYFDLMTTTIIGLLTPIPAALVAGYSLMKLRGLSELEGFQLGTGWWLGHFIGILIFWPLLRSFKRSWRFSLRQCLFFLTSLAALCLLEFYVLWNPDWRVCIFLLFIGILLISVPLPSPLLQLQGLILQVLSIVIYLKGGGINHRALDFSRLITLQAFMSMVSLTLLSLAALGLKDVRKLSFITLLGSWIFSGFLYAILIQNVNASDTTLILFLCLATLVSLALATFVQHLEKLEQGTRSLLVQVMNSVPIGIFRSDRHSRLKVCNREWASITGQSPERSIGTDWIEAIHPSERESLRASLSHFKDGEGVEGEYRVVRVDGSMRTVQLKLIADGDSEHSGLGVLGIIQDVTNIKATEAALEMQRTMTLQAAQLASLGEMAGGIAHQINNPLAIIHAQSHVMRMRIRNGSLDGSALLQTLSQIEETVDRISKITRSLLDFSGTGSNSKEVETIALSKVISETLALCQDRFQNAQIRLEHNEIPDVDLKGSPLKLRHLLVNVLNNAFDAAVVAEEKWVMIQCTEHGDKVSISITDSGQGIDPSIRAKIFDPFYTTKDSGKRSGLGLSIAKGLAAELNGNLYLQAASTHTLFVFEIGKSSFEAK